MSTIADHRGLPRGYRKLNTRERRNALMSLGLDEEDLQSLGADDSWLSFAGVMVENAVGTLPVPMGVATGFVIDGQEVAIPMATEEPSVIAAASYSASLISRLGGGLTTSATEPIMTSQIFVEGDEDICILIESHREGLISDARSVLDGMESRGGGFRGFRVEYLAETSLVRIEVDIDVRDAMGANLLNTVAERMIPRVEEVTGRSCLMGILTNAAEQRRAMAEFRIPFAGLRRGRFAGRELAERVELAARLAHEDPRRAVTHNKGIMNGITAIALATGNDTRAIEAAAHAWAARSGKYRGLSRYSVENGYLSARLELPLALGTVGGASGIHPTAQAALRMLGNPGAQQLARYAVALGLAQNLAAVLALVGEGIQGGHMKLHARRLAWKAGASEHEIPQVAERLLQDGGFSVEAARRELQLIREQAR